VLRFSFRSLREREGARGVPPLIAVAVAGAQFTLSLTLRASLRLCFASASKGSEI
jgi:hypothetical protein